MGFERMRVEAPADGRCRHGRSPSARFHQTNGGSHRVEFQFGHQLQTGIGELPIEEGAQAGALLWQV